jgi:hypothetical protein
MRRLNLKGMLHYEINKKLSNCHRCQHATPPYCEPRVREVVSRADRVQFRCRNRLAHRMARARCCSGTAPTRALRPARPARPENSVVFRSAESPGKNRNFGISAADRLCAKPGAAKPRPARHCAHAPGRGHGRHQRPRSQQHAAERWRAFRRMLPSGALPAAPFVNVGLQQHSYPWKWHSSLAARTPSRVLGSAWSDSSTAGQKRFVRLTHRAVVRRPHHKLVKLVFNL